MEDSVLQEIHWHDSLILSVHIIPERDRIEMRVLLPESARQQSYTEETVIFEEAYGYKEFEGPFAGSPTVLAATVASVNEQWSLVRLDTNAGYRELWCQDVYYQARKKRRNA